MKFLGINTLISECTIVVISAIDPQTSLYFGAAVFGAWVITSSYHRLKRIIDINKAINSSIHCSIIMVAENLYELSELPGVCKGISLRWMEASILDEEDRFDQRLHDLHETNRNISQEINELKASYSSSLANLNLKDIRAFFDSMMIYQFPEKFKELFPGIYDYDIDRISTIAASDKIQESGGLFILSSKQLFVKEKT